MVFATPLVTELDTGEFAAGDMVGSYKIEMLLGRGGIEEVYLASRADGEFGKKVAIKVVREQRPGPASIELFRTE